MSERAGITYPTHYSSLPRDAKVLMQFVSTLNAGLDAEAKSEVITRASLRLAKIRKLHAKSAYGDRVVIGRSEHA